MKNIIKFLIVLFFCLVFIGPASPQGNNYTFKNAGISFWYPEGWSVSEHILLLMMPKEENLQLKFQISDKINLDEAVMESINELKELYLPDTLYTINDITVNKLIAKEINTVKGGDKIHYLFLQLPDNKIIKVFHITPKDIAIKYNGDIQKIIKSIKQQKK